MFKVPIFWNLLQKLTKSSNSNLVDGVKLSLFSMNYRCMTFYSLPNDMSCGSRELLIAFGFVIAKTNILYELIQRRIENTPFNPKYSILTKTRVNPITFDENNLQNDKDKKNAKRWIEGRINLTKKLIVETEDKINKLSKQVSNYLILFKLSIFFICIHYIPT